MFLFFQAEDGIRDRNVTGVQTCALPISFDIINENRNTIMYKYSTINLLDKIYRGFFKDSLIAPLEINNTLDHYEDNLYLRKTNRSEERRVGKESRTVE